MFEVAELGLEIDKETFKQREPRLREQLLELQAALRDAKIPLVLVIAGVEGAGKGETMNMLVEWLDARGIVVHALGMISEEEVERPRYYRYWRRLPPQGSTGIFLGSWYTSPVIKHAFQQIDDDAFEHEMRRIVEFENLLTEEGVLVLKFWLHITKKQQKKIFKKLEDDPDKAWRVTPLDWKFHDTFDSFLDTSSRALRITSTSTAPWQIIESHDKRFRHLTVAERIIAALKARLAQPALPKVEKPELPVPESVNVINSLDLQAARIDPQAASKEIKELQSRIGQLTRTLLANQRSVVMVFEGADAAGKGGAIRRVVRGIDARYYRIVPIAAPTDEERAQPYLWRFWRRLPAWGHYTIYDRSWYGRVLVERIEGFCRPEDWQRAFAEINSFEEQMAESGVILLKFWLTISPEEQLRRFQDREATSYKHYKITPEDWRNREKWGGYEAAACEMVARTSTEIGPWTLVEAEDKNYARVKVLRTLVERLEHALPHAPRLRPK